MSAPPTFLMQTDLLSVLSLPYQIETLDIRPLYDNNSSELTLRGPKWDLKRLIACDRPGKSIVQHVCTRHQSNPNQIQVMRWAQLFNISPDFIDHHTLTTVGGHATLADTESFSSKKGCVWNHIHWQKICKLQTISIIKISVTNQYHELFSGPSSGWILYQTVATQ